MKNKYKHCSNCKGTLIPKRDHKSNDWSLICEHKNEKKCFDIFLEQEAQDVFKELEKWKINEFEIHDLLKIGKNPLQMLQAIMFVNNLELKVYKKKIEALRTILKSYFGFFIAGLIVKLKYKLPKLYSALKFSFFALIFLFFLGSISLINLSYSDEFLELSQPNKTDLKSLKSEDSKLKNTQKFKTNQDSDNDGIIDSDEIEKYKTNPLDPDTDGDGYKDNDEIKAGYDPLVPVKTDKK